METHTEHGLEKALATIHSNFGSGADLEADRKAFDAWAMERRQQQIAELTQELADADCWCWTSDGYANLNRYCLRCQAEDGNGEQVAKINLAIARRQITGFPSRFLSPYVQAALDEYRMPHNPVPVVTVRQANNCIDCGTVCKGERCNYHDLMADIAKYGAE